MVFTLFVLALSYFRTVLHLAEVHPNTYICTRNVNMVHVNLFAKMIYIYIIYDFIEVFMCIYVSMYFRTRTSFSRLPFYWVSVYSNEGWSFYFSQIPTLWGTSYWIHRLYEVIFFILGWSLQVCYSVRCCQMYFILWSISHLSKS